jgi:type VI secretion system protein ImpH
MAAASREPHSAVKGPDGVRRALGPALTEQPEAFEFFQFVRLMGRALRGRRPLGRFGDPTAETIRLGSVPSLGFPGSEVREFEIDENGQPRARVAFFGLYGPLGVLPTPYTEIIRQRQRDQDAAIGEFFDLFNHRLLSLFVRAWERARPGVGYERGERDSFARILMASVGLGTKGLAGRQAIPDETFLYYAGLLSQTPRSTSALEQIVGEYFDAPTAVIPFAGAWRPLEKSTQTRFRDRPGEAEQLGVGTILGDEVWDQQSVIRLRLGPLPLAQYLSFLPDGDAYPPLKSILRFYRGEDLDAEVQLVLKREEAPRAGLDVQGAAEPRLGWVSWMFSRPLGRDPDETVLLMWDAKE